MKIRSLTSMITTATCLALLATPAIAKPGKDKGNSGKGKDKDHGHSIIEPGGPGNSGKGKGKDKGHPVHGNSGNKGGHKFEKFNDKDHLTFRDFFAPDNRKNLPPGLRKNLERGKPLPPGWQKKVAAGQVIDAGWLDLMTPVSYDYFPNIRRTPGTRMYYHDNRLVRVDEKTRVIIDVINLLTR